MFKIIFKHGSAYFLISLVTKFTGFLLLPVITRYLSLDEYGLYANIQIAQQVIYIFGSLCLDTAYARFVYDYNSSIKRLRLLTSTIVTAFILWAFIYVSLSIGTIYFITKSFGYEAIIIALLVPFITLFQQFSALNISLMQSRHHTKKLLTITTSAYICTQILMLLMLVYLDMKINAFFISQFLIGFITMCIHLTIMNNEGIIKLFLFNRKTFIKTIRYGLGYMPASLSSWIFMMSDRYIIVYFISIAMAGKYAFIVQITMMIQVVMQSLQTALAPIFITQMDTATKESYRKIEDYIFVMIFFLLLIYVLMVTSLPFVIDLIFPESYRGDYLLIPILAMGSIFLAIRKLISMFLVYYKKSMWISISGYMPALVNVGLNFLFVPIYGIYAAAWTTLFSMFLYACVVFVMAQKLHKIDYNYMKIFFLFISAVVLTMVSFYCNNIIVNVAIIIVFASMGQVLGIYKLLRG
ncbi:oligosaccharide flippase family protein [Vibrio sp. 404]|uniref:Oligosaccharide flippase family protein n=1 Tax=Vibrio marinisediminis TaxID=2758441 RepID=A0A7W2IU82_9VIBR|nr:oligosaccharide flippase family protein [Vibrio marinisediminis]MBA5762802.1 oligosaccharide flippase family protein [Vibrio marinisediminis]